MNIIKCKRISSYLLVLSTLIISNAYAACDDTLPVSGNRDDVLVIVNDNSIDSCEVGRYYAEKRGLGQNNMLHIATRPRHLLNFIEFRNMMDQIIKYMQDNTLKAGAPAAPVCTDGDGPYYCQASMDHLRQFTKTRYLVTTRGVPTRSPIAGSALLSATSSTSIDNYLSYWLLRYFVTDVKLNFLERERAFGDGRGMRIVDPENDGELIVGRIDGVNLEASKALIDRIIAAEGNGLYGKNYGSLFGKYSSHARWFDYSTSKYVYGTSDRAPTADSWRYQLGMFGENRNECIDYLNVSRTISAGKAPQYCSVRFSESVPGQSSSRTPLVDDALIYLGQLHGQITAGGNFETLLNWVKNDSCTVKLCVDAADPVACATTSTDVFKELNTDCVGVADGFIGYNYQSYPVASMALWPTGYRGATSGGTNSDIIPPELRNDTGRTDNTSIWFRNTDTVANTLCYPDSDLSVAPSVACREGYYVSMYPQVSITSQTVNTVTPQQYRANFWYRSDNITDSASLRIRMRAYEPTNKNWVDYGTQTVASVALGDTGWTNVEATFQLDETFHTQTDLVFNKLEFHINTATYVGEIGFDDFSITELTTNTELAQNSSFTEGHKEVSGGDHAATFLSRLNGVGFWGSLSHHESNGHSFNNAPQETIIYFLRGLPLGDAVWWGEDNNSGIFYGDPIYSPTAIRFDYLNASDYVTGIVALSGSTVNGRNQNLVTTTFTIDYCPGNDFYICDQNVSWLSTSLSGSGGFENMSLGNWDTTTLTPGEYTLRLAVTSNNPTKSRIQTLYDYYPVTKVNPLDDNDGDGLNNVDEINLYGTDPNAVDTDGDGLNDNDEINIYNTNPVSSDSDGDGLSDGWEITYNLDPLTNDAAEDSDNDGLTNLDEFGYGTDPRNADTDADLLNDGVEINVHNTNPLLADTDGDSLSDGDEELVYGTDPLNGDDTDTDGMSDDWENVRGTNANIDDALVDADGDGFDNILEFLKGSLPLDELSTPAINVIYVDPNVIINPTGNEGEITNPFQDIPSALAVAKSGDTLSLASGLYTSSDSLNIIQSVKLIGPTDRSAVLLFNFMSVKNLKWGVFENLTLDIYSNYIRKARNVSFINNHYLPGEDIYPYNSSKLTFINNLIANPGGAGEAFWIESGSHVDLINNTVVGFPRGIYFADTTVSANIRNSILVNTNDFANTTTELTVAYSFIGDGDAAVVGSNGNIDGTVVAVDFVNAATNNYHLLSSSAAVDSGSPFDSAVNESTSVGRRINMGAYGNTDEAAAANDADADGLPDGWESAFGLNPANDDRYQDPDADGVYSVIEYRQGTHPKNGNSLPEVAYFVLNPEQLLSDLHVVSLVDNNVIQSGSTVLNLNMGEQGTIPAAALALGLKIGGNGAFSIGGEGNGTDSPVPISLQGTNFVIPHVRSEHTYYILSLYGDAQIQVDAGSAGLISNVAKQGEVLTINAGSDNAISAVLTSDMPILVVHKAGSVNDTYPVAPAAKEIFGVRTKTASIGALQDNTHVSVYANGGQMQNLTLNKGDKVIVSVGVNSGQGLGSGLRIVADKLIAAVQSADADGLEATVFLERAYHGASYGLPVNTQYVAVVCPEVDTLIRLRDGITTPVVKACDSDGVIPGKAYFGSSLINAGAIVESNKPVYLMYEAANSDDEHNLFGSVVAADDIVAPVFTEEVPTVTASTTPVVIGETLDVAWSGIQSPTASDWVGVYKIGDPDSNYLDWIYTAGAANGMGTIQLNNFQMVAGETYEIRLYENDGYTRLATGPRFVVNSSAPTVIAATTPVKLGGQVKVAWSGIVNPTFTDWVAIYVPSADDFSYLDWIYTDGNASGEILLSLKHVNLVAGQQYEVRLYAQDGYTVLDMSDTFLLQE